MATRTLPPILLKAETVARALDPSAKLKDGEWRIRCITPGHTDNDPSLGLDNDAAGHLLANCRTRCGGAVFPLLFDRLVEAKLVEPPVEKDALWTLTWREAKPLPGSLGERYFAGRNLPTPTSPDVRFHPDCVRGSKGTRQRLPAIVYLLRSADDEPTAVSRVFLSADWRKAGKPMALSSTKGTAFRLSRKVGPTLYVCEGPEDAVALDHDGVSPVWASTSAPLMKGLPLIAGVETLVLIPDKDTAGREAAAACAARWRAAGRTVHVVEVPGDAKDAAEHVARRVDGEIMENLRESIDSQIAEQASGSMVIASASGGDGSGGGGPAPAPSPSPDPRDDLPPGLRPVIQEEPGRIDGNATEAFAALVAQGEVYRRGRVLVVPDASVILDTRRGKQRHAAIAVLGLANLKRFLDAAACFLRMNQYGELKPTYPTSRLCTVLLEYVGDEPTGLPILNGVMRTPFVRRDGTICTEPGYDAASSIFFHPGSTSFPTMPDLTESNAEQMAEQALSRLLRPLREYQFDTSIRNDDDTWNLAADVGRAVAVSMFLSAVTVHATLTRPAYLADAPVFGSGKTILAELPALMLFGIDPPLISLADNHGAEELDKQFDSALLRGMASIVFDNARGDLSKFGKLTMLLTGATIGIRLFHTQVSLDVDNHFLISVSGNNATTSGDMVRRFLRARIDTKLERPDRKRFSFDPRDEVIRDRAQMVIDALTIVRAYQIAGAPEQNGKSYGSFETWARIVRDPLMWLGLPDIVPSNDTAQGDDPDIADLYAVLTAWQAATLSGEYTTEQLIHEASGDLRTALLAVAADRNDKFAISAKRLGWWLKSVIDRRVTGLCITRRLLEGRHLYRLNQPQQTSYEVAS